MRALHTVLSETASPGALNHKLVAHAVSAASSPQQALAKSKKGKKAKKQSAVAKKPASVSTSIDTDSQLGQSEASEPSTSNSDEFPTSTAASDDIITDISNQTSSETPPDTPSSSTPHEPSALARLCGRSVPDWLIRRAEDLGYGTPTGAQTEALPLALQGRDCVIHAQTGSGKTLTYLLPVLSGIDPKRSSVQAIVVVPTRELGIQVARVARQLAGKGKDQVADEEAANTKKLKSGKIQVMALLDGAGGNRQKIWLKADPPHLVVGTPDRIHKMIEYRNLRTNGLKFIVVDEFDAYPAATRTTGSLNKLLTVDSEAGARQTIFASATVPQHNRAVTELVKNKWARNDLVHVHVDPIQHVPKFLDHRYLVCEGDDKIKSLQKLVERDQPSAAIIFAHDLTERNKRTGETPSVEAVAEALSEGQPEALQPLLLQENARVQKRASIVQEFREGNRRLLVATDLAARGLDLPEVSHVYNFDLPLDATSYVHRAGRTARKPIAGTKGTVTCLVSSKEVFALKRLLNAIRVEGEEIDDT
ncbi:ATP-dependent RNA helicase DDX6/DHH1 [Klebsormidium nitens]|uniref:RNA helicase n=1 Tax=Klebsormidium nitens TaxID=105231 RepID=A0A1Y1IER7_KLENI|nr:ATP-dependent RNA helicase DDX6/DHH1 [Klebsormidium nitens]|eukprot:GAQ87246.1 ATP-dependent RNA helicase DDX6/DHH1 [Klebsormidium nitens]